MHPYTATSRVRFIRGPVVTRKRRGVGRQRVIARSDYLTQTEYSEETVLRARRRAAVPAGAAALIHGMAKCIYTRGCTGVRLAFAAIVFVFQLLISSKLFNFCFGKQSLFFFFFFVSPHIDIIIAAYLFLVVFAPLVLRFSSRVFLLFFLVSAICLHDSRTGY